MPEQATEPEHIKIPGSENSENAYLGECWCQPRGYAWPCPPAREAAK